MKDYKENTRKNNNKSIVPKVHQKTKAEEPSFHFVDNRPEAIAQRKLQEMAKNSTQVQSAAQLRATSEGTSDQQQQPLQKKENNTGLPDKLKSGMEDLSGYSMDDVKVHYNSNKPAQLQAHAFAQGRDIHLASGQEKHLPHEAWHVVQQKQGRVKPTLRSKGANINDDAGLEKEADLMGAKALQLKTAPNHSVIQKKSGTHGKGCGCGNCRKTQEVSYENSDHLGSSPIQLSQVIQRQWRCKYCNNTGEGRANKKKCPECGRKDQEEVQTGRAQFGTWFNGLAPERRQALLRQHGSHEAAGGVKQKDQGGGDRGKGDQHSDGVARATAQIREKYDRGEYD